MSDEVERLGILVELMELALGRMFETTPGGSKAKGLFVEDVRRLLADTRERQPDSPAVQTYVALLRRLGAVEADDPSGLGVVPTPEHGLPPAGSET